MQRFIHQRAMAYICSLILGIASTLIFMAQWASYDFSGTRTYGAGAVALGCLTYAFSGAIFGGLLAGLTLLASIVRKQRPKFNFIVFNTVWLLFVISAIYQYAKAGA